MNNQWINFMLISSDTECLDKDTIILHLKFILGLNFA